MFKSSDVAYWKSSNLNNISFIFDIWYGFCYNCLFWFIKSLKKHTQFDLGLGCAKDGDPHSESFYISRTLSKTKNLTSFLNISLCNFGTGYGCEHIGFTYYFNPKSTGDVFQVPSVPSKKSSNFCNNFSNSLRCIYVRWWHWVSITLCKSEFSYLASKIARNVLVAVQTCSDSYNTST